MNIFNICVKDCDLDAKKISRLLNAICERRGYSYWRSTEHFMELSDEGYTWLEANGDLPDLNGCVSSEGPGRVVVDFDVWFDLAMKTIKGEEMTDTGDSQKIIMKVENNPKPRYRKRNPKVVKVAKTIVRVLYVTQQAYTFKNVRSVQVIDGTVYIQHEREVTEGIKESIETEIDEKLLMAVVIHDVGNRSSFLRNIDDTWDYQAEDGTVINGGKQLGRIFKK